MLPLVVLVGPTAVGKSRLAIELAEGLAATGQRAEIVNSDSVAIYRGMDIGSAKPTVVEQARVPHHLLDILDITQTATVADFQALARETIAQLRSQGILPILVGGSSLYVRAIVDDFDFPGTDEEVRARWEAKLDEIGPHALHAILAGKDAAAAEAILPGNGRRIVRALEILELTGKFSAQLPGYDYALVNVHQFGLQIDREELDARIALRVDQMFADGLVAEVEELEKLGLREGVTASRTLGYQQVLAYLEGQMTLAEAQESTIQGTRRFARKQFGWYRRDPRIQWLDYQDSEAVQKIMRVIGDN